MLHTTLRGLYITAFAVLVSCTEAGPASEIPHAGPDLAGNWLGVVAGPCKPAVTMVLTETTSGVLGGTAQAKWGAACGWSTEDYQISGQHNHPSLSISFIRNFNWESFGPTGFSGTVTNTDSLTGKLDALDLVMVRQP
jgi:hypothetical protein